MKTSIIIFLIWILLGLIGAGIRIYISKLNYKRNKILIDDVNK